MATVDFDPEDYLDEVDTEYLINELKSRKVFGHPARQELLVGREVELAGAGDADQDDRHQRPGGGDRRPNFLRRAQGITPFGQCRA